MYEEDVEKIFWRKVYFLKHGEKPIFCNISIIFNIIYDLINKINNQIGCSKFKYNISHDVYEIDIGLV